MHSVHPCLQFYSFKIITMVHFRSKITSRYHLLIYFAVFHEKPAANLPEGTKVIWENKQIVFVHPDFKATQHASNSLFNKLNHYYLRYENGRELDSNQRTAVDKLKEKTDIVEFNISQFNELLDKIEEFGNDELAEFFQKKVSGERHFIALFHL